jgi:hypothetical protein
MCQQLTLECLGTPDTKTSDVSKLQLVGCSAESGGMALIYQVKAFAMVAEGAWPASTKMCAVIAHHAQKRIKTSGKRTLQHCTLLISVLQQCRRRITAEWRGAAPTSGLGVVPDLYKPKPKPRRGAAVVAAVQGHHAVAC